MKVWKWLFILVIVVVFVFALFKGFAGKEESEIRCVEVTRGAIERQAVATGTIGPELQVSAQTSVDALPL